MNDIAFCIRIYYAIAIFGVILANAVPLLRVRFIQYGKTRVAVKNRASKVWLQTLDNISDLTVPKSWFYHFYIVCFLSCVIAFGICRRTQRAALLPWLMVLIQSLRRVTEEINLVKSSTKKSQMWIGHYFAGLAFYICVSWSTMYIPLTPSPTVTSQVVAISLFIGASIWQNQLHSHLAALKSKNPSKYSIPTDRSFSLLLTPLYMAEILIYLAVAAAANFHNDLLDLSLLWTITNLTISAKLTKEWTKGYWGGQWQPRWTIIPFVY